MTHDTPARFRQTAGHILTTPDLEEMRREAYYNALPAGIRVGYDGGTPPRGWLRCQGRFDVAQYPRLAAIYPSGQLPDQPGEIIKF